MKRTLSRLTAGLLLAATMITPALAATGTVNTQGSSLRLRAEASTGSSVLKNLSDGTQVDVLSDAVDGWYQVSYKGSTGYVSAEYLTVTEDAAQPAPQAEAPAAEPAAQAAAPAADESKIYVKVVEGPLNIRSGPGTDYDRVGSLSTGRTAEVVEVLDGWYKLGNGYVCADYVTEIDAAAYAASYSKGQEIADYALQFKGYRYVHGGSSPSGFDCSGFTTYIYKQFGYSLNRTASGQLDNGTPVSMSELQPGDLVIFKKGNSSSRATHVGLYIGNSQFIHASTAKVGVIISKLSDAYYTTGFVGGRRIV